ncbi:MAG: M23 family metallopeptidase [Chloroflexota bacterium]
MVASRLAPVREQTAPARTTSAPVATPTTTVSSTPIAAPTPRRSWTSRLGPDRLVAVAVASILLGASIVSITGTRAAASTGGTTGDGPAPRIAVGGDTTGANDGVDTGGASGDGSTGSVELGAPDPAGNAAISQARFAAIDFGDTEINSSAEAQVEGPFINDGTLVKPIAVDTVVPDGSALVKTYKVQSGDTLAEVATRFKVSPMTIVWANNLKSKTDLKKGTVLRIPPVTGLIVKISATDTLDGIATRYGVTSTDILATNGLDDPNLVVGQVLVLPGAKGKSTTKPEIRALPRRLTSNGGASNIRPPSTYAGGKFTWPVVGGGNYISQYFHYGHYAIDIAADYGSTVRSAAAGTVIFAGWKSNGGGYQVWVAHGSGLYTTYNHMSGISVGRGQHIGRGQQVGRIGMTGNATGPHLHFEVWRGTVWESGQRVNPLGYF